MSEDRTLSSAIVRSLVIESCNTAVTFTLSTSERDYDPFNSMPLAEWGCNIPLRTINSGLVTTTSESD